MASELIRGAPSAVEYVIPDTTFQIQPSLAPSMFVYSISSLNSTPFMFVHASSQSSTMNETKLISDLGLSRVKEGDGNSLRHVMIKR